MFWKKRGKKRPWNDFAEEIHSHLAHEADQRSESGEGRLDADAAARRAFGNTLAVQEAFYEEGRWLFWDRLARDLRLAFRLCRRRPALSATVVLTLALGIGANSAIFSVINAVLLRPLPYKDPSRLAMLWSEDSAHGLREGRVSLPNFADWKSLSTSFEDMTPFGAQTFLLGGNDGPPERMRSARVQANFFPLLGIEPVLGRAFSADEERAGESVALLSYGLWQRRFGGSAQVLGSNFIMDARSVRIIGVMPASFQYPFADTQVWEPMTAHPYWARDRNSARTFAVWYTLGRVRPGVAWQEAQSEMNAVARRLAAAYPESKNLPEIHLVPLHTQTTGRVQNSLAVLFGSVFLLLLIACINVANLLLADGTAREREFSVRRALGAGRGTLAAQLLTESLVLAAAGGGLGLALTAAALQSLVAFGPRDIPRLAEAKIDPQVLLFTLLLSLFAAIVSGLWPAVRNGATLNPGSRQWTTVANRWVRNLLVIGEFSIALVLLVGAGLMVRSFVRLESLNPGFRPQKLLVMRIDLHLGKTEAQWLGYFREAIERAEAFPGVQSAGAVSGFLRSDPENSVEIEGRHPQQPGPCEDSIVGRYFETAGVPLKKGRFFTNQDGADSPPVAIINEAMERTYWPNENSIGKRFRFPDEKPNQWITVVGVTGDMHRQGLEKQVAPQIFRPLAQSPLNMLDLIVRTSVDPEAIATAVQGEIQSMDKGVAKFSVATVEQQLGEQTAVRRFQTSLVGLFSAVALLLSAIGIYGLMHFFVVQRANEIGVRIALGAQPGNVLALVLRQGLTLAVIGIGVGIVGALALTRLLAGLLYGVKPTDPVTFAIAPAILLAVAALACWIPARRAARIDPIRALRQE